MIVLSCLKEAQCVTEKRYDNKTSSPRLMNMRGRVSQSWILAYMRYSRSDFAGQGSDLTYGTKI